MDVVAVVVVDETTNLDHDYDYDYDYAERGDALRRESRQRCDAAGFNLIDALTLEALEDRLG